MVESKGTNWTHDELQQSWQRSDGFRVEVMHLDGEVWYRPKRPDGMAFGELCESAQEAMQMTDQFVPVP